MSPCSLKDIAFHEAGHAVVAELVGVRVTGIVISSLPGHSWTYHRGFRVPPEQVGAWLSPRCQSLIDRHIAIALAGGVAEEKLYPTRRNCHDQCDYQEAKRLAAYIFPQSEHALNLCVSVWREHIRSLFQRPTVWHTVKTLAQALMSTRVMNGDMARTFIHTKCKVTVETVVLHELYAPVHPIFHHQRKRSPRDKRPLDDTAPARSTP